MEEVVTFWLDNKISSGVKVAEIGLQMLVLYRDKYYLVEGGAAKMKGVRPLHFSRSSLPTIWKKALRGILPPAAAAPTVHPEDDYLPATTSIKKERPTMKKSVTTETEPSETLPEIKLPVQSEAGSVAKPASKTIKKTETKPLPQSVVLANCPYCNHKHELALDKGKNGKPFFVACAKCTAEFAVRYVPVTMYQAQVAAFK